MDQICQDGHLNYTVLVFFVYSVLELYLGKSKRVSANSFLELVWNFLKKRRETNVKQLGR